MLTNEEIFNYFGQSVDIDGDILAVGAIGEHADLAQPGITGVGHVFERDRGGPGNWGEADTLTAIDEEGIGFSISVDGDFVLAGSHGGEEGAYVFARSTDIAFVPIVDSCILYYLDDFSNANSGWPKSDSESALFGYNSGEYRILLKHSFWFGGAYPGVTFSDYLVTTDVRNVNNLPGLYGLLFSHDDWSSFFAYFIDKNGHYEVWGCTRTIGTCSKRAAART